MPLMIWKYEIELMGRQVIAVPRGAKFLPFVARLPHQPHHWLSLWAEVYPHEASDYVEHVPIYIVATGNPIPQDAINADGYIGSTLIDTFVWHVYRGGR